jgi:ABC-type nitrate/sulfonate/bicarbonate transport system permease component
MPDDIGGPIIGLTVAAIVGIVLLVFWGAFTHALNSTPAVQQMNQQQKGTLQQLENTGQGAIELSQTEMIEAVAIVIGVVGTVLYGAMKLFGER